MASSTLTELTAVEARDRMVRGDITAEAYAEACIEAVAARDGDVEAWAYFDADQVRAQARALDKQRASGQGTGALHGLPVGIKDIIDTADMPTENGSALFKGRQPDRDATSVAQLRAAGAVIMGKTVTTELANRHPGKTRNPHNRDFTPGGSSSGSAAGLAAGMFPLALGTQTGGSVIRPASYCGIHGCKPTLGLVSRTGVLLQSHTLDTVGVYGRSLGDLALILDVLSKYDPTDAVSYERGRPGIASVLATGRASQPRFAFYRTPAWETAPASARMALEKFTQGLGARCEEVRIADLDGVVEDHASVMDGENAAYYGPWLKERPDGLSSTLAERLKAAMALPAGAYVQALQRREVYYGAVARVLDSYDALITLPSPGSAPKGLGSTGAATFNGLWTFLGVPCVTLPLMQVDGMPCGVQLVGKRRDEGRLLAIADWLESEVMEKPVMR
ncbi:MAG: amidase [Hyphomicrobiaceae bacterium]